MLLPDRAKQAIIWPFQSLKTGTGGRNVTDHPSEWSYGVAVQRTALKRNITMAVLVALAGVAAIAAVFWIAQSFS